MSEWWDSNPHAHYRHQSLNLARLPISTHSENCPPTETRTRISTLRGWLPDQLVDRKIISIQTISVVTFVGFLLNSNASATRIPKNLINILTPWFHPILWNYFTVYPNLKCFNFKINVCCYAKGKSILTSYGVTFYYPLHLYLRNVPKCNFVPLFKRWLPPSQLAFIFERDKRLELSPWPWKGRMLPLHQSRITKPKCLKTRDIWGLLLSREQDSNLQPIDYKSIALPIVLSRHR